MPQPPNAASARAARPLVGPERRPNGGSEFADSFLDDLLPETVDWRQLVTRYPLASLAVASVAGFVVGRSKGALVLAALGSYVAAQFGDAVVELGEPPPGAPRLGESRRG